MRALVTGANGFVGRYLCDALREASHEVFAGVGPDAQGGGLALNLLDPLNVRAVVDLATPEVVFHLAAQTFVPESLQSPLATYESNIVGTANLLQAVRDVAGEKVATRFIYISSAEVYGKRESRDFPLAEDAALRPANPYAASKAAAEAIVLAEARSFGTDALVTRAFNHIGPRQSDRFVVSSFAKQLVDVAAGRSPFLSVGNLDARRDFLDVRDVVRAYIEVAKHGAAAEIYNVCSGMPVAISEILRRLITIARVPVEVREDPTRMRPSDVPVSFGDNKKLRDATGWKPEIPLGDSLRAIWEDALSASKLSS